jgi:hypothetical protein
VTALSTRALSMPQINHLGFFAPQHEDLLTPQGAEVMI